MKECTYSMRKSCKIWSACSEAYSGGEDLPPCTKESQTTDTQQPQERHCSHEFVYREYIGQTPGRCASCGAIVL